MADENTADLGGLQIPASTNSGDGSSPVAGSASAEVIRQRKERSDKGGTRGPRGTNNAKGVSGLPVPLSQTQFAALYNPEIWSKALAAPADALAAITGKKHWEVSQKEREALGATGSIAAQCFAVTDPRWLAVSLALITLLDVYGVRLAIDVADRRREQREKQKQQPR